MSKEIENLRASIQYKTDLNAARDKLASDAMDVLKRMPMHRIAASVQYLEKNLMPAVERKGGKSAPDLAVFAEIVDLLKWSQLLYGRLENQTRINTHLQLDLTIMRERLVLIEAELQKYELLEDLILTSQYDHIEKGVRARIEMDLKGKKSGF